MLIPEENADKSGLEIVLVSRMDEMLARATTRKRRERGTATVSQSPRPEPFR
jgi:hypothetical protein